MRRQPGLARRFFDRYEPVHAVTWMGYFGAAGHGAAGGGDRGLLQLPTRADRQPITRAVVGGDVPAVTPMTLRRDELHDDSAHLVGQ